MGHEKPFILVICGPPASGKTTLIQSFRAARQDIRFYEMDAIRLEVLPGPLHDKATRSAAYRVMHERARRDLLNLQATSVSASYMPPEHRAEVAALALDLRVRLFVVQCVCPADEAVRRFELRRGSHPGTDLTAERVRKLAEEYDPFEGALLIDTGSDAYHVDTINAYIDEGSPVDPVRWAEHCYVSPETLG